MFTCAVNIANPEHEGRPEGLPSFLRDAISMKLVPNTANKSSDQT